MKIQKWLSTLECLSDINFWYLWRTLSYNSVSFELYRLWIIKFEGIWQLLSPHLPPIKAVIIKSSQWDGNLCFLLGFERKWFSNLFYNLFRCLITGTVKKDFFISNDRFLRILSAKIAQFWNITKLFMPKWREGSVFFHK